MCLNVVFGVLVIKCDQRVCVYEKSQGLVWFGNVKGSKTLVNMTKYSFGDRMRFPEGLVRLVKSLTHLGTFLRRFWTQMN